MPEKTRKRFIAGAVCPQCQTMDTLMVYLQNNIEHVECVSCGYSKSRADDKVEAAKRSSGNVIGVFKP